LQTLRWHASRKTVAPPSVAREALNVFAPLANRLGIWQIKWEMEDLAFRFLEPDTYRKVASLLDEKRAEREEYVEQLRSRLQEELKAQGVRASVFGRPKHIYSIVRKMRGKSLDFDQVFDIRALRVIVPEVKDCYAALSWVHQQFTPVVEEFDDYIAKPKVNGYQSLHTIVRDKAGRPIEIQIRTQAMHDHAEHGVAAHWAYKEAGSKGYAGVAATSQYDAKIAVLRQLLAWERDLSGSGQGLFEDRIYVLTPDAAIVELPQGATPVDFAYSVHTGLGHRCRGARIDGVMVPLNTPLQNGQTVEITVAKEGGPSRDWLNADLGFLASNRAKAKVRAWFNEQVRHETVARGREAVEKLLQREGKTAVKLEDLASQLGFKAADDLFAVVGKDEYSLRHIETLLRPAVAPTTADEILLLKKPRHADRASKGGAERVIEVEWGAAPAEGAAVYPVDVAVEAADRQGLLRDISEVFAKEKMNVIGVQTQSLRGTAWMTFTVEIADSQRLNKVLHLVAEVQGVRWARRR
jgi:GTP pyrophosphokinase